MRPYPRSECPSRPFHLWDAKAKNADGGTGKRLPHRFYSDKRRAHMGALMEARWAKVGTVIHVFNASTGAFLGEYRRRVNDIFFTDERTYAKQGAPANSRSHSKVQKDNRRQKTGGRKGKGQKLPARTPARPTAVAVKAPDAPTVH